MRKHLLTIISCLMAMAVNAVRHLSAALQGHCRMNDFTDLHTFMTTFSKVRHFLWPEGLSVASLSGRSWRSFDPFQWHFAVVPTSLYPPKVTSERVVDAIGTPARWLRNDPKVTYLSQEHVLSLADGADDADLFRWNRWFKQELPLIIQKFLINNYCWT